MITADVKVDELVQQYPGTVKFLMRHNLPCVVCGEPFWGSLRELCKQKKWTDEQIEELVAEFNRTFEPASE